MLDELNPEDATDRAEEIIGSQALLNAMQEALEERIFEMAHYTAKFLEAMQDCCDDPEDALALTQTFLKQWMRDTL